MFFKLNVYVCRMNNALAIGTRNPAKARLSRMNNSSRCRIYVRNITTVRGWSSVHSEKNPDIGITRKEERKKRMGKKNFHIRENKVNSNKKS